MPDGAILNRYWDSSTTPRPESLKEDLHDAEGLDEELQKLSYFQHIRAHASLDGTSVVAGL